MWRATVCETLVAARIDGRDIAAYEFNIPSAGRSRDVSSWTSDPLVQIRTLQASPPKMTVSPLDSALLRAAGVRLGNSGAVFGRRPQ